MSFERYTISVSEVAKPKELQVEKKIYSATVDKAIDTDPAVQVLSTNDIDDEAVVRIQIPKGIRAEDFGFTFEGQTFSSVQSEVISPGVLEFYFDLIEEDFVQAYKARQAERHAVTADALAPIVEPIWKAKEEKDNVARQLEIAEQEVYQLEATDEEPIKDSLDDESLHVKTITRRSYAKGAKPDQFVIEFKNPFAIGVESQIEVARQFRFAKRGSSELVDHSSKDTTIFQTGKFPHKDSLISISQDIFLPASKFELVLTVYDRVSDQTVTRVFTSEELNRNVEIVSAPESNAVAPHAA